MVTWVTNKWKLQILSRKVEKNEHMKWCTSYILSEPAKDMYFVATIPLLKGVLAISVC